MDSLADFPEPVNPAPDLTRLAAFLCTQEYSSLARGTVLAYALATGTLEGCPMLEPEDRAEADALLEAAWPPVPSVSAAWDADRRGYDGPPHRWTIAGTAVVPPELDAEPCDHDEADEAYYAAWSDAVDAQYPEMPEDFPLEHAS